MKKPLLLIFALLNYSLAVSQTEVIYKDATTVVLRTTKTPSYRRVNRIVTTQVNNTPGMFGIQLHCDYNNNNRHLYQYNDNQHQIEFGGALFYNFDGNANGNFGLLIGYDYGMSQWWREEYGNIAEQRYWDIRAGFNISKYFSIGFVGGQYKDIYNDRYLNDFGAYANINIPCGKVFGIFVDGKWTQYQGFSVGGGVCFKIEVKQ